MNGSDGPFLTSADAFLARMAALRETIRREREADRRALTASLKAIRQSQDTLARCVVWSPFMGDTDK